MKDHSQLRSTARVVSLPLRTRFRGLEHRELMLFQGAQGWAEWSPFAEYPDPEAATWLAAAVDWAENPRFQPSAAAARISINATLPAVKPTEVALALAPFGTFRTVKIKVAESGQELSDDLERIMATRKLWPGARIRLDANGGWSVLQALAVAEIVIRGDLPVEYLEQPVATLEEMVELRAELAVRGWPLKIAADELVRKAADPLEVSVAGGADILVLKAQPLGGVSAAAKLAAAAGLPVVVSSALESSVGLAMGLNLASLLNQNLGGQVFDAGLGTASLLSADVVDEPLMPKDGWLTAREVEPSERLMTQHAASPERTRWWLERLERCLKLID